MCQVIEDLKISETYKPSNVKNQIRKPKYSSTTNLSSPLLLLNKLKKRTFFLDIYIISYLYFFSPLYIVLCFLFMGKSLPSTTRLQEFTRIISSNKLQKSKRAKPISQIRVPSPEPVKSDRFRVDSDQEKSRKKMESSEGQSRQTQPLSLVVSDCVKRWFQDTLKEAKAGDTAMQVLVGQMYFSGYGVGKDPQKVNAFIYLFIFIFMVWWSLVFY